MENETLNKTLIYKIFSMIFEKTLYCQSFWICCWQY